MEFASGEAKLCYCERRVCVCLCVCCVCTFWNECWICVEWRDTCEHNCIHSCIYHSSSWGWWGKCVYSHSMWGGRVMLIYKKITPSSGHTLVHIQNGKCCKWCTSYLSKQWTKKSRDWPARSEVSVFTVKPVQQLAHCEVSLAKNSRVKSILYFIWLNQLKVEESHCSVYSLQFTLSSKFKLSRWMKRHRTRIGQVNWIWAKWLASLSPSGCK